jgi:hypothetical protein
MKTDIYSVSKSFIAGLDYGYGGKDLFPKLRVRRQPSPVNSPLDRSGI